MKKILIYLFLVSFLVAPLFVFGQEIKPTAVECEVKHNLSNYGPCCADFGIFGEQYAGERTCLGEPGNLLTGQFVETLKTRISFVAPAKPEGFWPSAWPRQFSHCCLIDKILTVGDYIFVAILVVAILVMLMAAWTFLIASGNPDKIAKARNLLIYGLIGVAVAFLAGKVLVRVIAAIMS